VIVEYLEETEPRPLHPADPLARAQHRAWIEMASATLARIAGFYSAQTDEALAAEARALTGLFRRWETTLGTGPWFGGEGFSLVDAAAAPIFRYLDAFEAIGAFRVLDGCPKVEAWRRELAGRPSVAGAVSPDYPVLLRDFLRRRDSALSRRMPDRTAVASPA
jgi:glutathione S-transferase